MKRWLVLFMLITMYVVTATPVSALEVNTRSLPPQALIIVEGNYDFPSFTFTPKLALFIGSGFQQPWMYASFSRGQTTGSIGMIVDYRGLSGVAFAALKVSHYIQPRIQAKHEFHVINHDNDFFYWGQLRRKFEIHNSFFGLYWEMLNSDVTRLQIGPQVGVGNFEFNILFGEDASNIRALWIIPI